MLYLKLVALLFISQVISKSILVPYDQECFFVSDAVTVPKTSMTDTSLSDMDKLT